MSPPIPGGSPAHCEQPLGVRSGHGVGTQLEGYRSRSPIGPATDEQLEEKACALRKRRRRSRARAASREQLEEKACALRKALDFEACDREYLERGSTRAGVTIVMFHVRLGC